MNSKDSKCGQVHVAGGPRSETKRYGDVHEDFTQTQPHGKRQETLGSGVDTHSKSAYAETSSRRKDNEQRPKP